MVISSMGITYNAANQVTAISAEGRTTSYTYDAAQRMNQVTDPSVSRFDFFSESAGEIFQRRTANR